ncbi:MAG: hypothetical protein U0S12_14945 [Fimbriimonadales bacterium]
MRWLPIVVLLLANISGAQKVKELGPAPIADGPYTGRVSAIAITANTLYVGGADGGVWRSDDAGATWRPLTDFMPTTSVGAIAIDPTNPSTLYVGTGEANFANHSRYGVGIYKSLDGGETWTQLAASAFAGRCISKIIVDPSNPQRLFASVTPAGGFPEKAGAKNHPLKDGPVGVFRSTDGGVTWAQLLNGLPNQAATDLAMSPVNPNVLYAGIGRIFGATENGIYKSSDGGTTWAKLAGGLPTTTNGRINFAIAPSNANRLYALIVNPCTSTGDGGSTKGAYRSDDGGTTWTALTISNFQATYGWYLSVVTVQPTNPDTVVMGGYTMLRSTNAGASWSTITAPHVDNHALEWDALGRLVNGNDGGVYQTTNIGSSWTSLNSNLGLIQFYAGLSSHPSDREILLGGHQDNGCSRRLTSGMSWDQVTGGDGGWTQIDQANPLRMFTESQGSGTLYRSVNGGGSFSNSGTGISTADRNCFLPAYVIDPTNSQRMLYGTHRVYETLNGGTSWTAVSGDVTTGTGAIRTIALARSNPQVVYIATNDGRFSQSTDGGRTFAVRLSGRPGWPRVTREIFVSPTDSQRVYLATAAFGTTQVQRSLDGGVTWTSLDGDLPDIPVNVVVADERTPVPILYAGADDGLYRSADGGSHWSRFAARLPHAPVIDILGDFGRERLVVATQGRGAWEIRLPYGVP